MNQMQKRLLKKPVQPLLLIKRYKYKKMFTHKLRRFVHSWMKFFFQMKRRCMILLDCLNKQVFCLAEVDLVWLWVGTVHHLIIPLGPKPSELVSYFEAIEGVPKIRSGYNPATWMLKVTSSVEENRLGVDFAEIYRKSSLYQYNQELVEGLSIPASNSKELHFPTKYCRSPFEHFLTCLWKQNLSYWRNPHGPILSLSSFILIPVWVLFC